MNNGFIGTRKLNFKECKIGDEWLEYTWCSEKENAYDDIKIRFI